MSVSVDSVRGNNLCLFFSECVALFYEYRLPYIHRYYTSFNVCARCDDSTVHRSTAMTLFHSALSRVKVDHRSTIFLPVNRIMLKLIEPTCTAYSQRTIHIHRPILVLALIKIFDWTLWKRNVRLKRTNLDTVARQQNDNNKTSGRKKKTKYEQ